MKIPKQVTGFLFTRGLPTLVMGLILASFQFGCQDSQLLTMPTKLPDPPRIHWDYVALGDERSASSDWPEFFADIIEADLGFPDVSVHNLASGEQTSEDLLALLRTNPSMRAQISSAEVITVWTGGYVIRELLTNHNLACDPAVVDAFGNDLEKILDQIIILRGQNPTIIRLLEFFQPRVNVLDDLGILEEKNICLHTINMRLHQVAAKYEIPVAPTQHAFNGLDGNTDSMEAGYLANVYKFSIAGNEQIAMLLQELGYEQYQPTYLIFRDGDQISFSNNTMIGRLGPPGSSQRDSYFHQKQTEKLKMGISRVSAKENL